MLLTNFIFYANFTSIRYFTLTLVGLTNNLAPLVTVLLAVLILGEKMPLFKSFQLFVAFGGCVLMILSSSEPQVDEEVTNADERISLFMIFQYVCLILNPIVIGYLNVLSRQMRNLSETVVTFYTNLFGILLWICVCYTTG